MNHNGRATYTSRPSVYTTSHTRFPKGLTSLARKPRVVLAIERDQLQAKVQRESQYHFDRALALRIHTTPR